MWIMLEEWADPRVIAALAESFAQYDRQDISEALFATADLFLWTARETSEKLEYDNPMERAHQIMKLVTSSLSETAL